jgi:taurine transport system permease protein
MRFVTTARGPQHAGPAIRWLARGALVLVAWQIIVVVADSPPIALPPPTAVAEAFGTLVRDGFNGTSFAGHLISSLRRLVLAFGASLVVGVPVGIAMGRITIVRDGFTPIVALFRPVPSFAWLAILIVWFGFGELSKIAVVFLATVTVIALGTMDAVRRVPPHFYDAARTLGASRGQIFWKLVIPAALPQMWSSARVALTIAWSALIAAELVAAKAGIGVIILQSSAFLRTDVTFAGLVTLAIVGAASEQLMAFVQRRYLVWGNR